MTEQGSQGAPGSHGNRGGLIGASGPTMDNVGIQSSFETLSTSHEVLRGEFLEAQEDIEQLAGRVLRTEQEAENDRRTAQDFRSEIAATIADSRSVLRDIQERHQEEDQRRYERGQTIDWILKIIGFILLGAFVFWIITDPRLGGLY